MIVALVSVPAAARAQHAAKMKRVAFVATTSPITELLSFNPASRGFARGMRELGYVEGKNLLLEWRSAEGKFERFPEIMRELVKLRVDVIVTVHNTMTQAAKEATRSIPIVMASSTSPVENGLVASLARPGANVTGFTLDAGPEIFGKRLQLLKQLVPASARVAVLGINTGMEGWGRDTAEAAGRAIGVKMLFFDPAPTEYAAFFSSIEREHLDALLIAQGAQNYGHRRLIAEFAARSRIPAMYPARDYIADADGFVSYGPDISEIFRRAAGYVDRILKGANPATMPVERPTKFELIINLKAAKAIGLTVPSSLLVQADQVIE